MLRLIGTLNGAVWLGAALFFSFGIAPGIFSAEMKSIFGDYYTGVIAQTLLPRYFTLHYICGVIALLHLFAEYFYAGRPFRRISFGLIVGVLALGLLAGRVFEPKLKTLHAIRYAQGEFRNASNDERAQAKTQFKRLHAVSRIGDVISLIALVIYWWRVTNPPDTTRFITSQKFRG